jgi:hypothetical protein
VPSTVGIVASGEDVLNDAVFWVDAGRSSVSNGALTNLGTGGSALNAVFGNSTGVDSFDPALLTHTGTNHLYLPGLASNYASAPDSAALDITGDIEIVARVALDDWTPTGVMQLVGSVQADPNRRFRLLVQTSGVLQLEWWPTGSAASSASRSTTTAPALTDGTAYWIKATLTASTGKANFYYAADQATEPSSWTEQASAAGLGATSIANVTAPLEIGSGFSGSSNPASGKFYRVIVRNGIGGTTVFDADFTTGITSGAQTTFTESSANAATVTINRATSGRKSVAVTRPILLFGTDDYLEVADNDLLDFAASDSFTVVAIQRVWATQSTARSLIAKKADSTAATQGWALSSGSTTALQGQMQVGDATNGVTSVSASRTNGTLQVISGVRNTATDTVTTWLNNTAGTSITDTTTSTSANAEVMRIGRLSGAGTGYADMELVAAAVWRRALNANEIATIVNRYT